MKFPYEQPLWIFLSESMEPDQLKYHSDTCQYQCNLGWKYSCHDMCVCVDPGDPCANFQLLRFWWRLPVLTTISIHHYARIVWLVCGYQSGSLVASAQKRPRKGKAKNSRTFCTWEEWKKRQSQKEEWKNSKIYLTRGKSFPGKKEEKGREPLAVEAQKKNGKAWSELTTGKRL